MIAFGFFDSKFCGCCCFSKFDLHSIINRLEVKADPLEKKYRDYRNQKEKAQRDHKAAKKKAEVSRYLINV